MKVLRDCLLILIHVKAIAVYTKGTTVPGHEGTSFLMGFLEMDNDKGISRICVTSGEPSLITIKIPYLSRNITTRVTPGVTTKIDLPTTIRMRGLSREDKGILIASDNTISVYATNARAKSRDAYVIFPTSALGTEYVVTTYEPINKALVGIIALRDNTLIQIKLRLEGSITYKGKVFTNGDILRIFLNKQQTFQLQHKRDLTGTFVVSSGPVVVIGGNIRTKVPTTVSGLSHLATQLVPVSKWGTRFMTSPIAGRKRDGDLLKIVAAFDNTTVSVHGEQNFTLNAGGWRLLNVGHSETRYIVFTEPAMLLQYNRGSSGRIHSEPFSLMVPPIAQYAKDFNLPIPVDLKRPPFVNYLSFIVKTSEVRYVVFDRGYCNGNLTQVPIPSTNYSVYWCPLRTINVSKTISISNASKGGGIAPYIVGHTDKDGYGYLGGMEMRDVNCRRLFPEGITTDNSCDWGMYRNTVNITSCDPNLSIAQIPIPKSEYLKDCEIKTSTLKENCERKVIRTWRLNSSIVAKQEIRWKKLKPMLVFSTFIRINTSDLSALEGDVRNMSRLCPGDRLDFNDTTRVRGNGTKLVKRLWIIREECGRITTARQSIIVPATDDVQCEEHKSSVSLALILSLSLGIFLLVLVIVCIFITKRRKTDAPINIYLSLQSVEETCVENANNIHATSSSDRCQGDRGK
ncbi:uncharacterized protein LOC114536440 isoform X2 [Dendronephthya gigantea]|uniref:uncharacterized protein LOC114536440 isoform X2 n=1 Tax=Dendronephthya gigantea TaxID=151771 RepID=UPI00106A3F51|nr:uncharacterized protein LOC114536440 isoform X2 [Dendronephthya gigantea]